MSVLRGMYIEKCRMVQVLLADIAGAPKTEGIFEEVEPHQDIIMQASSALFQVQNKLREKT